jgi:hypothetical protein
VSRNTSRCWQAARPRWLSVDYDHDNFLYDTDMKGFILGATYRFK